VEFFEQRYASFRGLNLTFEVREGIIKHSRDYDAAKYPQLAEYLLDQRPTLEAQLIDLTDEIAYNTADLDDGVESEIISIEQIREHVPLFEECYREAQNLFPNASEKLLFNESLKRMVDRLASNLIATTMRRLQDARVATVEAVRNHPERLIAFSERMEAKRKECKDFLYKHLYFSPELKQDKERSAQIIRETFSFFMKKPETLPETYREQTKELPLARVVCDYIAGMTDNFIMEQHKQLLG
jgi:dGTPase